MTKLKSTPLISIALLLLCTAGMILHASYYFPFIADDSLISLRYASRLLDGDGLTWTDGQRVEGYSNLLWILLVAFYGMFGVDLIDAARNLGIFGMTIIMSSIVYWYTSKNKLRVIWFSVAIALFFLSTTTPIAVWAIGGLEQPLYGSLIAVSIPLMYSLIESKKTEKGKLLLLSLILGLLCITRPDGPIFSVATAFSFCIISWFNRKKRFVLYSLLVLLFPIFFYVGQLLFRLYYYGELLPNSAFVKITPSYHHFCNGLKYFKDGVIALFPFSILAIASMIIIIFTDKVREKGIYLSVIFILWSIYIVLIGGDIYPAYRHFIPLVVIFAFALVEGSQIILRRVVNLSSSIYYYGVMIFGFFLFIPYMHIQFTDTKNRRAIHERWEWEGKKLGLLLKKAFSTQQPLLAVTAAGCLPYWSELPTLDMLGLNDYYLARNPPKNIGNGFLGHELGDGKYVLSRKPDMIIFDIGSGPVFRSGYDLQKMAGFHKRYIPIKVITDSEKHSAIIYFSKYSYKIGIQNLQSSIIIPGFLFKGENSIAYLNKANKLVTQLKNGQSASLTFDSKSFQTWLFDVKASEPDKIRGELKQNNSLVSIKLVSESTKPIEIEEIVLRRKY